MLVLLARVDVRIPGCSSLKEKRHVVKGIIAAIRSRYEVSVAEVGAHDLWQRSELGVAVVGADLHQARRVMHGIERIVASHPGAELLAMEVTEHRPEDVA